MSDSIQSPVSTLDDPALLDAIYREFRTFFDLAEDHRRWSIRSDIPWDQCNRSLDPVIADVVETFCCVELYLPDYLSKLIPQVRASKGRAWFLANWGYEESKHSLALGDWLLKSGHRTPEQMADMEADVFQYEWQLPHDSAGGMVCYTMMQELATWLNYRNLRRAIIERGGDPALEKLLTLISVDERAHHDFFRRVVLLLLKADRAGTLEQIRRVVSTFQMPALNLLKDRGRRIGQVESLGVFTTSAFYADVLVPFLSALGLTKADLKRQRR